MSRTYNPAKHRARKLAQRANPTRSLPSCERCGAPPGRYPRHHPDIEGDPEFVIILCDKCHEEVDRRLGKWGPGGQKKPAPRPRIEPLPALPKAGADVQGGPLIVFCGGPGSGKTTMARYLGLDLLEQAGRLELARVTAWLAASIARPSAIEHGGVREDIHEQICEHVKESRRRALLVVCYARPNTVHDRIMRRSDEPVDCSRHELSAWGERVLWVLKQLYPPQRAMWINCEAPLAICSKPVAAFLGKPRED